MNPLPLGPVSPAAEPVVAVRRLDLTRFRNWPDLRLDLGATPLVLTGPNGAGKTNLLEAISFLAPGRGLRGATLSEIDCHDPAAGVTGQPWAVAARLDSLGGPVTIGTGRDGAAEGDRRQVRIDGVLAKGQTALARHLGVIWLTPQMDRLFQEGAAPRRRFLDRLVFGFLPDHAKHLSAYEAAMRERGRLLREGRADPQWLMVLEQRMAAEGIQVAAARRIVTQRLDAAAALLPADLPFPVPALRVAGAVDEWLAEDESGAEARLAAALAAARRRDAEAGGATHGPHRSDLAVRHAGRAVPAVQCSTGEQKALLIALILAHARLMAAEGGAPPILLLDEVAAHLDQERRSALIRAIVALKTQAWMTGTDASLFAALADDGQYFRVAGGRVIAEAPP